jgi:DNA repair protein RadC
MEYEKSNLSIKSWAEEDRPREKLMIQGRQSLTDAELVAILIASGNDTDSAVELSKKILNSVGENLNELGKLSINDLKKFKGIGEAKAITIIAALELGRRRQATEAVVRDKIMSSRQAYEIFQPHLADLAYESFYVLYLNRSNKLIWKERMSTGGIAGTVVDTRMILRTAIEKLASGIFIAHNHPSGNLKPSEADVKITQTLQSACNLLDMKLLDHLIIGDKDYFSFHDEGMM